MTDEQLVALSQQGSLPAFNRLASRVESSVFRFILRTLGNREDARDVCQETLLKAYQNIARLRDGAKFKSWVHHIALNLCRDRFRSTRFRSELRSYDDPDLQQGPVALELSERTPLSAAERRSHLARTLEAALKRLPEEQRYAILLREYHGFTSEEIGEITGVPSATVRTRIYYGLRTLRRTLGDAGPQEAP